MRILAVLLLVPGLGFCQTETTLSIKGYTGQAAVVQVNGKSYVEVEGLARLTSGSLSFKGSQITLIFSAPAAAAAAAPVNPAAKLALSRDFLRAAIEELSVIREWRVAIVNAIQNNFPVTEDWVGGYGRNAESKLQLAAAAASKDSDRDIVPLITNEYNNMKRLSDQYLAMHKNLTYISPDSLDNDPLNQQVINCAQALGSVAADGHAEDVPACH